MYVRNSGVLTAPANCDATAKIKLTNDPQNEWRFLGGSEMPPIFFIPLKRNGYIVMLTQSFCYFLTNLIGG